MDAWHEAARRRRWEPVGDWRRPYCYPRPGETTAAGRRPRGHGHPPGRRPPRRLDPRQAPGQGPRCRPLPRPALHRRHVLAARRPLPLRPHVQRERLSLRRRRGGAARPRTASSATPRPAAPTGCMAGSRNGCRPNGGTSRSSPPTSPSNSPRSPWSARRPATVLEALGGGIDLSREALPFMPFDRGHRSPASRPASTASPSRASSPTRSRCRPPAARRSGTRCCAAGARFGIAPYGTEALHVMRAEKGFIMIGDETDGTVTPQDLGLGWAVSKKKPDFIGKRAQERPDLTRPDRKQLVGLADRGSRPRSCPTAPMPSTARSGTDGPTPTLGHVTSSYFSPTLGRSIAMALIAGGAGAHGRDAELPGRQRADDPRDRRRSGLPRQGGEAARMPDASVARSTRRPHRARPGRHGHAARRSRRTRRSPTAVAREYRPRAARRAAVRLRGATGRRRLDVARRAAALRRAAARRPRPRPRSARRSPACHHLALDVSDARVAVPPRRPGRPRAAGQGRAGRSLARRLRPGRLPPHPARPGGGAPSGCPSRSSSISSASARSPDFVAGWLATPPAPAAAPAFCLRRQPLDRLGQRHTTRAARLRA